MFQIFDFEANKKNHQTFKKFIKSARRSEVFLFNKARLNLAKFTEICHLVADKNKVVNCAEDEFDCDDATCIAKSLKCNGFYNCRFRWDEDNCQVSTFQLNVILQLS